MRAKNIARERPSGVGRRKRLRWDWVRSLFIVSSERHSIGFHAVNKKKPLTFWCSCEFGLKEVLNSLVPLTKKISSWGPASFLKSAKMRVSVTNEWARGEFFKSGFRGHLRHKPAFLLVCDASAQCSSDNPVLHPWKKQLKLNLVFSARIWKLLWHLLCLSVVLLIQGKKDGNAPPPPPDCLLWCVKIPEAPENRVWPARYVSRNQCIICKTPQCTWCESAAVWTASEPGCAIVSLCSLHFWTFTKTEDTNRSTTATDSWSHL